MEQPFGCAMVLKGFETSETLTGRENGRAPTPAGLAESGMCSHLLSDERRQAAGCRRHNVPRWQRPLKAQGRAMSSVPPIASRITAMLGPTNTGKTHACIERMLTHESGMLGLPLRLLAREVYDRVSTEVGEQRVALVTGEEKRIPNRPDYWICTVEAMPVQREVDFLAVDEIQLISHNTRGHVFTDRLLHARGRSETWFLGSDTVRPLLKQIAPTAVFKGRPRLSKLTHTGQSSLGRLPPRSCVVAFSLPQVYELAERIRARHGGAAVVLGALSPRTRNAQVAMYQAGEVDYMVATDAIGMGLNMAVDHVAFASTRKFDGTKARHLTPAELAQIAGRAGRYLCDGSFGTLAPTPRLPDTLAHCIESHHFENQHRAVWRNSALAFDSLTALIESLDEKPPRALLAPVQRADDAMALKSLSGRTEVAELATAPWAVRLLWQTCQIPDFRKLLPELHAGLVYSVFEQLIKNDGQLDDQWLSERVERLDDSQGDLDTLIGRIAFVRTWTFVSHQKSWLRRADFWQHRTREVEDRLSDALHQRLVQRFVESRKRTVSGHRRAGRNPPIAAEAPVDQTNPFAQLAALRESLSPAPAPASDWVEELLSASFEQLALTPKGELSFKDRNVGKLRRGRDVLSPELTLTDSGLAAGSQQQLERRLRAHLRDLVESLVGSLRTNEGDSSAFRGICYQVRQGLGCAPVRPAKEQVASLTATDRRKLASRGVVVGRRIVYLKSALRARKLQLRSVLCATFMGPDAALGVTERVSIPTDRNISPQTYLLQGFVAAGPRAIRCDAVEQVLSASAEQCAVTELANRLGCPRRELPAVAKALGIRVPEAQPYGARRRPRGQRPSLKGRSGSGRDCG